MIPHRSFTILRRICASVPPVCSRRQRIKALLGVFSCDLAYSTENGLFSVKGRHNYFCCSATAHAGQITHPNSSRVSCLSARYSSNKKTKTCLHAPVFVTWLTNASQLYWIKQKNKINPIRKASGAVLLLHKKESKNLPWLRLQSVPWPFCPYSPVSRILWDANLAQTVFSVYWTGKDRMREGRTVATFLTLVYSVRKLRHRTQRMNRDSCICARLIRLVIHIDAFHKTGTGRLACSTCVPHGALRASDCQ